MSKPQQASDQADQELVTRQLIQNERWITIGRVTSSVCHELTNRMQATQGALSLAREEPFLSADMRTYLEICQQEVHKVCAQTERLRSIYRPETDRTTEVNIAELLEDVRILATDALASSGVTAEIAVAASLPNVRGKIGQLQFAVLALLLNLVDAVSLEAGTCIQIDARIMDAAVQIVLWAEAPLSALFDQDNNETPEFQRRRLEYALGLPTLKLVMNAQDGDIDLVSNDAGLGVRLSLPI